MTTDNKALSKGQQTRNGLEADIQAINEEIEEFNAHWLNNKNIMNSCAAVIMAFIFTGMIFKSIEMYLWASSCGLVVCLVGIMLWRNWKSTSLNDKMEAAQSAFKEYKKGRGKRKK